MVVKRAVEGGILSFFLARIATASFASQDSIFGLASVDLLVEAGQFCGFVNHKAALQKGCSRSNKHLLAGADQM